jgi:PAS domain S-box-containing protein
MTADQDPGAPRAGAMDVSRRSAPTRDAHVGDFTHESGELHRLLVESVRDYAIFALDPHGYILSWNAGAQQFKGYTADEAIGQHFSIFYPEEMIARRHPEHELETAAREGHFEEEGWRVRKDRTLFWANVVITALRDAQGTLVGFAKAIGRSGTPGERAAISPAGAGCERLRHLHARAGWDDRDVE